MVGRARDLEVRTSCFDPDSDARIIHVRERQPDPLYRVFLFLDGRDLPYVESVQYVLHPSFATPNRTVRRTPDNPICKLAVWAWGEFAMHSFVFFKTGERFDLANQFKFSAEIVRAKRETPTAFVYEE